MVNRIFKNWKTTLAGALHAAGLGGAANALVADDPKTAALCLLGNAVLALIQGALSVDPKDPQ